MKTAVELYKMDLKSAKTQYVDGGLFEQFRDNDYDQTTLREYASTNKWGFMEDFWCCIASRNQYSKEFIIEMFSNCDKQEREQIDRLIHDQLSCLWDQLDPNEPPYTYMDKIMKWKSYIINAGYYLRFCDNEFKCAQSLYQFVEQNLNICVENIIDDFFDIDFIYNKRYFD